MKVLNVEPFGYSEIARKKWLDAGWQYEASSWPDVGNGVQLDIDAIIVRLARKVSGQDLDSFPNLRYLITATTGLDHVNQQELQKRGIKLVSLRDESDFLRTIPSTAEHTWALCLALMRNIPAAVADVTEGHWNRDVFRGYQLSGKRLGIIGLGRIGIKVAAYARVFNMNVGYYDPYIETRDDYDRYESLKELLQQSDIVSVHVHLTPETENMLNHMTIGYIKKGAFIINTSRGKIWDEHVLSDALLNGMVGGIATDVLATELSDLKESPLWKAMMNGERVIITPHIGGATWDAMWTCEEFMVEKTLKIHYGS